MGLTNRNELFISHYLRTWNATQAAIEAGYSPKTAYSHGQRLLKNVEIAAAIRERIDSAAMSADEVLARLAEHGRADMDDIIDSDGELDLEKARAAGATRLIKKLIVSERTIYQKDGGEIYTKRTTVELHDSQAALALLGKKHKLFTEQHEHTGKDGGGLKVIIEYENPNGNAP